MSLKILYKKPHSFLYIESQTKFYVPKYYGFKTYGEPEEIRLPEGEDIAIKFRGELRDYQKPIAETFVKSAKSVGGGLLEIHTGGGKTVLALKIIAELKKRPLLSFIKNFCYVNGLKE